MVVKHHPHWRLLKAISPKYALVSAARYSPWRLPSDKVHNRYKKGPLIG